MLHERIKKEQKRIQHEITKIRSQLNKLPPDKLICSHHKGYTKWYVSDGHTKKYIPKSNRKLAEQLAIKKYLSLKLEELNQELLALDFYLRHHKSSFSNADHLLKEFYGYRELLSPFFQPKSQKLQEWMHSPYERNPKHPENLIHETMTDLKVRSKSEAMIVHFLLAHQIPFRYEASLVLGNKTFYPDFTIMHPVTEEIFYWEHFGLMDDPDYAANAFSKLNLFSSHGIIPTVNLITTYETKEHPSSIHKFLWIQ